MHAVIGAMYINKKNMELFLRIRVKALYIKFSVKYCINVLWIYMPNFLRVVFLQGLAFFFSTLPQ